MELASVPHELAGEGIDYEAHLGILLHSTEDPDRATPNKGVGRWTTGRSDTRSPSVIDQVVFENPKKGIDAMIKITMAFHGLKDKRFIITNVFWHSARVCVRRLPIFIHLS